MALALRRKGIAQSATSLSSSAIISLRRSLSSSSPGKLGGRRPRNAAPTIIPTLSPYLWTVEGMDANALIPDSNIKAKAVSMFASQARYHDPASLGYAMPTVSPNDSKHTEIAFLGRSNVGKSSLVGALLGNKSLVRVSKKPGCTRTLNLFSLKGQPLYLVDLPGYGFARAPGETRDEWMEVATTYLQTRGLDVLRRTMLLIDARHGVKPIDELAMSLFDQQGIPYQLVLTKIDSIRSEEARRKVIAQAMEFACRKEHVACMPALHLTSVKDQLGITELRESIAEIVYAR